MAHRGVHRPPYGSVQGLLIWARSTWAYIDGACLRNGVDIKALPAHRMINVIQTFFLEEQYIDFHSREREPRKEEARRQLDAMMHRDHKDLPEGVSRPTQYLEPDENGFYPGLEQAGRLDA